MGLITALIIGSIVAAGASIAGAAINASSQQKTNQQNIKMQEEINAQNQYNIEHAHQIEMDDLKQAGLNPILTATGGQGAPISMLQAPKAQAPQVDLSGVGSAVQGVQNILTTKLMMDMRQDMASERSATLSSIAKGHDAQSAANAALRASMAYTKGQSLVNSSKGFDSAFKKLSPYQLKKAQKIMSYNLWK